MRPFRLHVEQAELDDLRRRLRATRWPEPETHPSQGIGVAELRSLCAYWADGYDWRATEARLNACGQFRTTIDGLEIHFLHVRSTVPGALPLVLTHGWPGAVVEYLDALPALAAAGFDCVVPSLPGYGWSGKPAAPGWGVERIARAWAALMARLGYERYGAQGTDWGTSVSAALGQVDADHVVGIHVMPPLAPAGGDDAGVSGDDAGVSGADEGVSGADAGVSGDDEGVSGDAAGAAPRAARADAGDGGGYSAMHRTRPQTVGYALTDSPAGLAAWIAEKLRDWADPRAPIPRDRVLDIVTTYWLTRTAASSARLYWESLADVTRWLEGPLEPRDVVHAPTACTVFPHELQRPTRAQAARRFTDIRSWSEPPRGGHFPALEQPELFVEEVRRAFSALHSRRPSSHT